VKLYGRSFPTVLTGESIPLVKVRFWVMPESLSQQYGTHGAVSTIRVLPSLVSTEDAS